MSAPPHSLARFHGHKKPRKCSKRKLLFRTSSCVLARSSSTGPLTPWAGDGQCRSFSVVSNRCCSHACSPALHFLTAVYNSCENRSETPCKRSHVPVKIGIGLLLRASSHFERSGLGRAKGWAPIGPSTRSSASMLLGVFAVHPAGVGVYPTS